MARGKGGGLAAWSIRHPVGVSMIALAVAVLGLFALGRLSVDLLPHIIYPEVRVRILDAGVPAKVMEDRVTRQLEEQLAVTEDAIAIQSRSSEGASNVDLSFEYGKDIDLALRDASTRLDRAKRFLPDTIDTPIIYKRDPSQIPVLELVVASGSRDPIALRDWVDYDFSKRFLNLSGVASVEVGGGLTREIQVLPDQGRLAAMGITVSDLGDALREGNREMPAGRLTMERRELAGRTAARFADVEALAALPLRLPGGDTVRVDEVARVMDTHADERLRIRLDGVPGIKVSIQKQPRANTVKVVDAVNQRLVELTEQRLIPPDVSIRPVSDQAQHVRNALDNSTRAAISGTLLAMAVVYLFLGNLRRTLIVGSAIPLAVMVTFVLMGVGGLTFNIMTLGGLALGIGMLVDNTIVMLENIQRHQRAGESDLEAGTSAAEEINSAVVAATSTNLAAVLPFLFVGGLVGLLFRELIITISAAIIASLVVALTLVPAWAVKVRTTATGGVRQRIDTGVDRMRMVYAKGVSRLVASRMAQGLLVIGLVAALGTSLPLFTGSKQTFLPDIDNGQIRVSVRADPGVSLEEMDRSVRRIETVLQQQSETESVFSTVGGFVFGRTEREVTNLTMLSVQLVPRVNRAVSSGKWIKRVEGELETLELVGVKVHLRALGIRGVRISRGDDDVSLRIQGPDLSRLAEHGEQLVNRLRSVSGLTNLEHSLEETRQELAIRVDRQRAADLGLTAEDIGYAARHALAGEVVTDFLDGDRAYDVRLRLPRRDMRTPADLEQLVLFAGGDGWPLRLGDVANLELMVSPAEIRRDNQRRMVEVTGSVAGNAVSGAVYSTIQSELEGFELPDGYTLYDGGGFEALQEGRQLGSMLLALALFLVYVVMAVQYESLRNPLVILLSVPFAVIGVAAGLTITGLPLSMPVWLGMIMLAGIVVNNAIVLVEYVELARSRGAGVRDAVVEAARLRLRPILMTTLTTVAGMLPLALGWGEGAELLQPLAITLIGGLSVSLLVTLALIPVLYQTLHPEPA
ncbi:efflux RND transporter permease subunit [Thiohalomonas denitrificans]|uniref:efflux RND transporter permease subunit n=1 Tax=Thiohalomonas denitrificans TaxID=415747 RepID=UPI0026EE116C|nr:efflux RND transporter permease subunit [Thiohalomonas denitrificans]